MGYTTQALKVNKSQDIYERPQVVDDTQKSSKIEKCEDILIKDGRRAAKGMAVGAIIAIPIWIIIISAITLLIT
jgi:hypothetical protein